MAAGRGAAGLESWCSGTPANTTGWRGEGKSCYPIAMIDDATSRLFARFVRSDSTEENHAAVMELPGEVRPLAF
jgi:hypothetical protein